VSPRLLLFVVGKSKNTTMWKEEDEYLVEADRQTPLGMYLVPLLCDDPKHLQIKHMVI
jgi:hypothetical protein